MAGPGIPILIGSYTVQTYCTKTGNAAVKTLSLQSSADGMVVITSSTQYMSTNVKEMREDHLAFWGDFKADEGASPLVLQAYC